MSKTSDKYMPKTKAEFEAYRKSMDNATDTMLKNGGKRGSGTKGNTKGASKK